MSRGGLAWIFAVAMISGCAADDVSYYKQGLKAEGKKVEKTESANPYRLADLSPGHKPDPKSDEAGLWLVMEKIERQYRTAGNRVRKQALNNYLEKVTCRVAGPFCSDIRVYLMRSPGFNAAMYPNGMMYVLTGLLLRVENEAQLAAVIGHEAGHYLRQHSMQRIREAIDSTNSLLFFQIAMAAAGVPVVGDVAMLMTLAGLQSYSRNHEREADGYGLLLLSRAGYNPSEAWKVWDQITREKEADKDYDAPSIFEASHPHSEERMEQLRTLAKVARSEKTKDIGRERLRDVILPFRAEFLRDEMHLRKYGPFEVLLDRLIDRGDNLAELYYFKGELHRLRNKDGDLQKALGFYGEALKAEGTAPVGLLRSMGLVHLKLGRNAEARTAFEEYMQRNPQASDIGMIRQLIEVPGS